MFVVKNVFYLFKRFVRELSTCESIPVSLDLNWGNMIFTGKISNFFPGTKVLKI